MPGQVSVVFKWDELPPEDKARLARMSPELAEVLAREEELAEQSKVPIVTVKEYRQRVEEVRKMLRKGVFNFLCFVIVFFISMGRR